ncbi:hypothetical protein [Streptomyces sp. H34-S4]|uniref:hypothetical protein n=1 Tax=Streptomyces sp. H34-S4 TaxID=2996463 RepID=UPI002D1E4182|nr:hypothetical protein [Streptomyces sp. H34-S4]
MTTNTAHAVHQAARPTGFPAASDFAYVQTPVPQPRPGTALVENLLLSVDPPPATAGRCPRTAA